MDRYEYGKEEAKKDSIGFCDSNAQKRHFLKIFTRTKEKIDRELTFTELFWMFWACAPKKRQEMWEKNLCMQNRQIVKNTKSDLTTLYLRMSHTPLWYFGLGTDNNGKTGDISRLETLYKTKRQLHTAIFETTMRRLDETGLEWTKEAVLACFDMKTLLKTLKYDTEEELKTDHGIFPAEGKSISKDVDMYYNGKRVKTPKQLIIAIDGADTTALTHGITRSEAAYLETMAIDVFDTQEPYSGYNIDGGGDERFTSLVSELSIDNNGNISADTKRPEKFGLNDYKLADQINENELIYIPEGPKSCFEKRHWRGPTSFAVCTKSGIVYLLNKEKALKLCDTAHIAYSRCVKMSDIPKMSPAEANSLDLTWNSFSRKQADETCVKQKDFAKYYLWEDPDGNVYWWSDSPVLNLNYCYYEFFKKIPKSCSFSAEGIDLTRVAGASEIINYFTADTLSMVK